MDTVNLAGRLALLSTCWDPKIAGTLNTGDAGGDRTLPRAGRV